MPTIQCLKCSIWHHRHCVVGFESTARSFTCPDCQTDPSRVTSLPPSAPTPITPPSESPGKKSNTVRFGSQNTFYEPPHPAGSSLPAPGLTPTMANKGSFHVHPLLDKSAVTYDLIEHPFTIVTRNNFSLSLRTVCEPATTPPLLFRTRDVGGHVGFTSGWRDELRSSLLQAGRFNRCSL